MMNNTERVREYLKQSGPASRIQIGAALNLTRMQVEAIVNGLRSMGDINAVRLKGIGMNGRSASMYSTADKQVFTQKSIVAAALASEPELARVWK